MRERKIRLWPGFARQILDDWEMHTPIQLAELSRDARWDPDRIRAGLLEDGDHPEEVEELYRVLTNACNFGMSDSAGHQLLKWVEEARNTHGDPYKRQRLGEADKAELIQWPSSLERLDRKTGGGYGVTVFAGQPKCGKSLAAETTAIQAAACGWKVVYVNAELTDSEIDQRADTYCAGDVPPLVKENFLALNTGPACRLQSIQDELAGFLDYDTDRLLVVLDSINRLAENDNSRDLSGNGYWERLRAWSGFAMQAARLSRGAISFLVVSELNSRDQVKGRSLEYSANMLVRFVAGETPDTVEIMVQYSRSTPSGEIGPHFRNWQAGAFEPLEDIKPFG